MPEPPLTPLESAADRLQEKQAEEARQQVRRMDLESARSREFQRVHQARLAALGSAHGAETARPAGAARSADEAIAKTGGGGTKAPTGLTGFRAPRGELGTAEAQLARWAWPTLTRGLANLNLDLIEFVLPTIILTPIIFFLYFFRFVWCNLLGGGRPRRLPILGIVGLPVWPVGGVAGERRPEEWAEYVEGVTWISVGSLVIFIFLVVLIVAAAVAANLCQEFSVVCSALKPSTPIPGL